MFYYSLFGVLTLVALLEFVSISRTTKNKIYSTGIFAFIIFGALRWNTGNDWKQYMRYFNNFDGDDLFFLTAMEPGFARFVQFLRFFSTNFTLYLTVLSVLVIGLKGIYFRKFTNSLFLVLLVYFGTNLADITAVRQMLAVSFCCIATIFIVEKRPLLFMLFVYIAMQVHVTSVIFFLAYPIYYLNWTTLSKIVWLFIAIFIGVVGGYENFVSLIVSIIPSGFGLDRVITKALRYLELGNAALSGNVSANERMLLAIAKRSVLLPVFFVMDKYIGDKNKYYSGLLNLYAFGNIFFFTVYNNSILQRLVAYFYIVEVLLLCIIFENVKSKFLWFVLIVLYCLLKLISFLRSAEDLLVPYIWIFSDDTYRYMY